MVTTPEFIANQGQGLGAVSVTGRFLVAGSPPEPKVLMHGRLAPSLIHTFATLAVIGTSACGGSSSEPGASVASISISGDPTRQLVAGETAQLQATVKDNSGATVTGVSVQWTTSNQSIATVNSGGLVTAVAEGTASITASASQKTAVMDIEVVGGGMVGPAGATLTFLSGKATLVVPSGALAQPVRLVLAPAILPPNTVVMQRSAFFIGPANVVFAQSTVLTLTYDPARIPPPLVESELKLSQATAGGWIPRAGTVNSSAKTLTTPIAGGGTFAVIVP